MSGNSTATGSYAAHAEEFDEDTQETVPGTKQSAQVKTKRSKRDGASDSGYSSRTTATQSTSGSNKLLSLVGMMAGSKKSSKEIGSPEKASKRKSTSKSTRRESFHIDTTHVESREDAARMRLSGESIQRTTSHHSHNTSPRLSRAVRPVPIPTQPPQAIRIAQPVKDITSRPSSYHAGVAGYQYVQFAAPMSFPAHVAPPIQPSPQLYHLPRVTYVSSAPVPMSPNRQTAYPFPPTIPPQYIPSQPTPTWEPPYQPPFVQNHPAQSALPRRYSMAGPAPVPIVEYPMVPHPISMQQNIEYARPPSSYHVPQALPAPPPPRSHYPPPDEGVFFEDEAYYRHQEQARIAMPPPQRPAMRHASTANEAIRRANRNSLEHKPRISTSSRTESFSSLKDEAKVPLMRRSSSSRNVPVRVAESPASPDQRRRSRPQSYHSTLEQDIDVEPHRPGKRSSGTVQPLTTEAIKAVEKASKPSKSRASETGSRGSGGKKVTDSKTRPASRKATSPNEAVSLEVGEGCAASIVRDGKGFAVRVRTNEESKARSSRHEEREEQRESRRYSISSRRESGGPLEAIARTIMPRRASSSHPTSRRERVEPAADILRERLTDKLKYLDDTAVEDDDYSEPEVRKKRNEKLTNQRLRNLKPTSESRQSSRSARSAKSSKSDKSNTSRRRAAPEGEPF